MLVNAAIVVAVLALFAHGLIVAIAFDVTIGTTYNISVKSSLPAQTQLSNATALPGYLDDVFSIPIGFNFAFFSQYYTNVNVDVEGALQFQTALHDWEPFPFGSSYADIVPVFFFFYGNTFAGGSPAAPNNHIAYATTGSAPSRQLLIRFTLIPYCCQYTSPFWSTDTVLYETSNAIEVRFYRVDANPDYTVVIGMQDLSDDYTAFVNNLPIETALAAQLQGTSVTFTRFNNSLPLPTYSAGTPPRLYAQGTYNVSLVSPVPSLIPFDYTTPLATPLTNYFGIDVVNIGFNFTFYGKAYTTCYVSTSGDIQFNSVSRITSGATMPNGNSATLPVIAWFFSNLAPIYNNQMAYQTFGAVGNRYLVIRFSEIPYQSPSYYVTVPYYVSADVVLYEATGRIEIRYYRLDSYPQQTALIGIQNRIGRDGTLYSAHNSSNADYAVVINAVPLAAAQSTALLQSYVVFTPIQFTPAVYVPYQIPIITQGGSYNVSIINSVAMKTITAGTDVFVPPQYYFNNDYYYSDWDFSEESTLINLPFYFTFYQSRYNSLVICSTGSIQFTTATCQMEPLQIPGSSSAATPIIAFAWASLLPRYSSTFKYQIFGDIPANRGVFQLRVDNVMIFAAPYTSLVAIDVFLYQMDGRIEIRYYHLDVAITSFMCGIQDGTSDGSSDDFAVVGDAVLSPNMVNVLMGSTIQFIRNVPITGAEPIMPIVNTYTPVGASYKAITNSGVPSKRVLTQAQYLYFDPFSSNQIEYIPIQFNFTFYNIPYIYVGISNTGNLQFYSAPNTATTMPFPTNVNVPMISWLWPGATFDQYELVYEPYYGYYYLDFLEQVVAYQTFGNSNNNKYLIIRIEEWLINAQPITCDIVLYQSGGRIELRYYTLPSSGVLSDTLIGIQSAITTDYASVVNGHILTPAAVTTLLTNTIRFIPLNYLNLVYTPPILNISNSQPTSTYTASIITGFSLPDVSTSPTSSLIPTYINAYGLGSVTYARLGFWFPFYQRKYNAVMISTSGNLQFTTYSSTRIAPSFNIDNHNSAPYIAWLWTSLYNTNSIITYTTGNNTLNTAIFWLRLSNELIFNSPYTQYTSVDILLYQATGIIDILYRRIDPNPSSIVSIGIYQSVNDYIFLVNQQSLIADITFALFGNTLRYTPNIPLNNNINNIVTIPIVYSSPIYSYSINITTVTSSTFTPVNYDNPFISLGDGYYQVFVVPIGFIFTFYNIAYDYLAISSNGNIQFSTASLHTATGFPIPTSAGFTPIITFCSLPFYLFEADWDNTIINGYQTTGIAGSRSFILRFQNVFIEEEPYGQASIDVILYESTGNIQMSFYRFDQTNGAASIGIQGNNPNDYSYILNNQVANPLFLSQLTNSIITFSPINYIPQTIITSFNFTFFNSINTSYSTNISKNIRLYTTWSTYNTIFPLYAYEDIATANIGFPFTFYNQTYQHVAISTSGNLQFASANSHVNGPFMPTADGPLIAVFWVPLYVYPPGMIITQTTGNLSLYQGIFTVRYSQVVIEVYPYSSTITIDILFYQNNGIITINYYNIDNIGISGSIGIQGSNNDYNILLNDALITPHILNQLVGTSISFIPKFNYIQQIYIPVLPQLNISIISSYNITYLPTISNKINLPIATTQSLFYNSYMDDQVIPLNFPFTYYNISYDYITVTTVGIIVFGVPTTFSRAVTIPDGVSLMNQPVLAWYMVPLYVFYGVCSYATIGSSPTASFVLRFDNAFIYDWPYDAYISADIVFFQSNGVIEIRYYEIGFTSSRVSIGGVGTVANDYWTLWNNQPVPVTLALTLSASTLVITPNKFIAQPYLLVAPFVNSSSNVSYQVVFRQSVDNPIILNSSALNLIDNPTAVADSSIGVFPPFPPSAPGGGDGGAVPAVERIQYISFAWVFIGFKFTLYNTSYVFVGVTNSGVLQFASTNIFTGSISLPNGASGSMPMLAWFMAPMIVNARNVYYQTTGSPGSCSAWICPEAQGSRQFLLRFQYITVAATSNNNDYLSADVILYEANGNIEVRYYAVPRTTASVTIGMIGSASNYWSAFNNINLTPRALDGLNGTTLLISPTGPYVVQSLSGALLPIYSGRASTYSSFVIDIDTVVQKQVIPTSAITLFDYSFNEMSTVNIGWPFTFYDIAYMFVTITSNSDIFFTTSNSLTDITYNSLVIPTNIVDNSPVISWFHTQLYPAYQQVFAWSQGTAGSRSFYIRWEDVEAYDVRLFGEDLSVDIVLFEADGRIEIRYYQVPYLSTPITIAVANSADNWLYAFNNEIITPTQSFLLTDSTWVITPVNYQAQRYDATQHVALSFCLITSSSPSASNYTAWSSVASGIMNTTETTYSSTKSYLIVALSNTKILYAATDGSGRIASTSTLSLIASGDFETNDNLISITSTSNNGYTTAKGISWQDDNSHVFMNIYYNNKVYASNAPNTYYYGTLTVQYYNISRPQPLSCQPPTSPLSSSSAAASPYSSSMSYDPNAIGCDDSVAAFGDYQDIQLPLVYDTNGLVRLYNTTFRGKVVAAVANIINASTTSVILCRAVVDNGNGGSHLLLTLQSSIIPFYDGILLANILTSALHNPNHPVYTQRSGTNNNNNNIFPTILMTTSCSNDGGVVAVGYCQSSANDSNNHNSLDRGSIAAIVIAIIFACFLCCLIIMCITGTWNYNGQSKKSGSVFIPPTTTDDHEISNMESARHDNNKLAENNDESHMTTDSVISPETEMVVLHDTSDGNEEMII